MPNIVKWSSAETDRNAIRAALGSLRVEVQQLPFQKLRFDRPGGDRGSKIPDGAIQEALAKAGYTITDAEVHPNGGVSGMLMKA